MNAIKKNQNEVTKNKLKFRKVNPEIPGDTLYRFVEKKSFTLGRIIIRLLMSYKLLSMMIPLVLVSLGKIINRGYRMSMIISKG